MADRMLAQGDVRKPKLTIEKSISSYCLNQKFSDVCFLVGDEREKIYAHRFFLVIESEVFEAMFFGELKETKYEIEVPDLSPVGFRNMIKYLYTKKVDEIDFSEIYPTYMAANKYLVLGLIEDLTEHIAKNCLDASNVCVMYDQLKKLAISDSLTHDLKRRIAAEFSAACASDSFKQIGEDTLVSILKFNQLNIAELDLLKACMKWADGQAMRQNADQENSRATFDSIKNLIRFGDLSLSDFGSIPEIKNYLTTKTIGSIFLHISDQNLPIQIDYRSPRVPRKAQVAKGILGDYVDQSRSSTRELKFSISVDKAVSISSTKTYYIHNCTDLKVELYTDKWISSHCKSETDKSGQWKSYTIDLPHFLEPNRKYELRFSCSIGREANYIFSLGTSKEMSLRADEGDVLFKIESDLGYHCIERIHFYGPFD